MDLLFFLLIGAGLFSEATFSCLAAEEPVKKKYIRMDLSEDIQGTYY